MAFFCTVSGVRIVSPGVAKCAGGEVPEFDASDASEAAESAARAAIVTAGAPSSSGFRPTASATRPNVPENATSASADADPI